MSHLDKTYVIFDSDVDRWARARMMQWKTSAGQDFRFFQAHDLLPLVDRTTPEVIKAQIWQRLCEAAQVLVLLGDNTRNCRFALWEIDMAQTLRLPIVVANLNGLREIDPIRCPAMLREWPALHVEFKSAVVEAALEAFPAEYEKMSARASGARRYSSDVYRNLSSGQRRGKRFLSLTHWMMAG
jgi:hypothetical protein